MKVRIWQEQADLFEISVLEQTVEVSPAPMRELQSDVAIPVVLIGKALVSERLAEIRSLFEAIFKSGRTILVVPPFGDLDVGRYLDTPVGVRLLRRTPDATVRLVDAALGLPPGKALSVRSDHVIETALGAGLIATDGSGKPVALRYQPRNTSGAAILCTTQLLSYTALSNEEDRQALLAVLVGHRGGDVVEAATTSVGDVVPVDAGHVATMLVALAAERNVDPTRLRMVAKTFLQLSLDAETVERVLEHLEAEGILTRGSEGERRVQEEMLEGALDDLGLHACARELQEIVEDQPEVRT
ncbi:MAG: hypothetical protein M0R76_00065 [Proteobacteria bacterium]|nr:hypothetical protein [Pseudomonadota bacterium]